MPSTAKKSQSQSPREFGSSDATTAAQPQTLTKSSRPEVLEHLITDEEISDFRMPTSRKNPLEVEPEMVVPAGAVRQIEIPKYGWTRLYENVVLEKLFSIMNERKLQTNSYPVVLACCVILGRRIWPEITIADVWESLDEETAWAWTLFLFAEKSGWQDLTFQDAPSEEEVAELKKPLTPTGS